LSYAPFDFWWIGLLGFIAFFYLLLDTEHKVATAWWFAFGWFGTGISWVHVSIADFGGIPLVFSVLMMALLCGYLALFPALAIYLVSKFGNIRLWPLFLPFVWLVCEWLRSWFLTGFPWLSIGYSQLNSPLAGWMPVIGEFGLSALIVLFTSSIALAIHKRNPLLFSLAVVIPLVSGWILNEIEWTTPNGEVAKTAMIQGNIKQELRWVPELDEPTMMAYWQDSQTFLDHDLIVWPEAAIPKLEPLAQKFIRNVDDSVAKNGSSLITGVVNYNHENGEVFNSLIVLGKQYPSEDFGNYRYFHNNRFNKHHLLPIGEFVPFESALRSLAPIFDLPMSSFTRGDFQQRNLVANGIHLAPAICFEIAFPRQVRANLYNNTQIILTVSNDAWFGRSHGPAQHMEIAQVRAKEFGLPVIRSTNNGISGFIDHRGDIVKSLPQFERTSASYNIRLVDGTTPYRTYGDFGAWAFTLLLTIAGLLTRRQNKAIEN
jgi:apolipoprotein N-acyltransferase